MTEHPSGIELDEWSVTRAPGSVADHVAGCDECAAYLQELSDFGARFLAEESPDAFVRRPAIAAEINRPVEEPKPFWARMWFGAFAAVATAAVAFIVVSETGKSGPNGGGAPGAAPGGDVVRLKGDLSLAVVLKRGTEQTRHTGSVSVRPGDKLRVELTAAKTEELTVGVLLDGGEWIALRDGFTATVGTGPVHDDALEIDSDVTRGWVLVGTPDQVATAVASGTVSEAADVTSLRIEWGGE